MGNSFSMAEWIGYYSRKRIVHQWTQLHLLSTVPCRRILEIGPAMGLVTAMLVNAGYEVETLDQLPRCFAQPDVRHIQKDLRELAPTDIGGYDAIICCETLEHLDWDEVGPALSTLHSSGAQYLLISVPYEEFQVTFDLYANLHTLAHSFSLRKLRSLRQFRREPPGGHQWEVGYRGYSLRAWETRLRDAGWSIAKREFTEHCRSVFHLLEAS